MRILVYGINYSPELTGIGKYTGEMCAWLVSRGHEVRVVTAPPYYPEWQVRSDYAAWSYRTERLAGVRVFRCPLWVPKIPSGIKRVLHLMSFVASSFPVVLAHAAWRPDVVLTVEPPVFCAPFAWLTARLAGAVSWLHIQDYEVDAAFELGLLPRAAHSPALWLERALMRRFDRVSTISTRMRARLAGKGADGARSRLFLNWIDCRAIYPLERPSILRQELGIAESDLVVLYSGNMGEKQGLGIVIEAARRLAGRSDICFVMCGAGAARARLQSQARDLPGVIWLPLQPAERLNELLNAADIHLLPQAASAAGIVMPSKLGGMLASARPVIATAARDTDVADVVERCGIVVEPDDVAALAAAIERLCADPRSRAALGRAGRQYAEHRLSIEAILGGLERELATAREARR